MPHLIFALVLSFALSAPAEEHTQSRTQTNRPLAEENLQQLIKEAEEKYLISIVCYPNSPEQECIDFLKRLPSMDKLTAALPGATIALGDEFREAILEIIEIDPSASEDAILKYVQKILDAQKALHADKTLIEKQLKLRESFVFKALSLEGDTVAEKRANLEKLKALPKEVLDAMEGLGINAGSTMGYSHMARIIRIDLSAPKKDILNHLNVVGFQIKSLDADKKETVEKLGLDSGSFFIKPLVVRGKDLSEERTNLDKFRSLSQETLETMRGNGIALDRTFGTREASGSMDLIQIDVFAPEEEIREHVKKHRRK